MTVQTQPAAERPAWFQPGVRMAVLGIVVVPGGCVLLASAVIGARARIVQGAAGLVQVVNTGALYQ